MKTLKVQQAPKVDPTCHWTLDADEEEDIWVTSCGHRWEFRVGGPRENGMQYCGYCGKKLQPVVSKVTR